MRKRSSTMRAWEDCIGGWLKVTWALRSSWCNGCSTRAWDLLSSSKGKAERILVAPPEITHIFIVHFESMTLARQPVIKPSSIALSESSPSETASSSDSSVIYGCDGIFLAVWPSFSSSASHKPPLLFLCQLNRLKVASLETLLALSCASLVQIGNNLRAWRLMTYFNSSVSICAGRATGSSRTVSRGISIDLCWAGSSSPVSNIQHVLCGRNWWSCGKCALTSRLVFEIVVSPNGGEGVKGTTTSGLTR